MKKRNLKAIVLVSILIVLCLSVGVYAGYSLSAKDVNYTKPDGTTVTVSAALDELNIKVPTKEIGDEVTVGGEQFYVLEWDNRSDMALLLAKYNLNQEGTAQQAAETETTGCAFSSTNYWASSFESSPSESFNLNDFIGFTSTDTLGKTKSYGVSKGAVSSRLLSYEEANALATKLNSDQKITDMLIGRANLNESGNLLSFWLGSTSNANDPWAMVGFMGNEGATVGFYPRYYTWSNDYGVRPVITVLKSNIS